MTAAKDSKSKVKVKTAKPSDAEQVSAYMHALDHPLKTEIEAVRSIIKKANTQVSERIKWNAPSYYFGATDLVTFNHRMSNKVHLVFHHVAIVQISSPLLEGDYKDRRMMYFSNMKEVTMHKKELERIINEYVSIVAHGNKE